MKRKIILSSIIAILIVSLIGCGQEKKKTVQQPEIKKVDTAKGTDSNQKKDNAENETPKTNNNTNNANVQEQVNTNIFSNEQPLFNEKCVNINPGRVYYDGDSLVLDAYVTNGLDYTVYNIQVDNITLSNKSELIASDTFGLIKNASIGPHQFIKWTFKFPAGSVKKQNAELNNLRTESNTKYKY